MTTESMDFGLGDEYEEFRQVTRRFAEEHLRPLYQRGDVDGKFPWQQAQAMGSVGLLGFGIAEPLGGQGPLDLFATAVAVEEVSRADVNCTWLILHAVLAGELLGEYASGSDQQRWLPLVCSGQSVMAIGVTEPDSGSDAAAMRMRANRDGDGWVLHGEKTSISLIEAAGFAVVLARTNEQRGASGISAFLVSLDLPGVARGSFDDLGNRTVGRGWLHLDGVRVGSDALLGSEGEGFKIVMREFDRTRILIALQCLAAASVSLDETFEYVQQRHSFGQPLARHQGLMFPLVEQLTYVEAARLLAYRALWLRREGKPHTTQAAMCKGWAPRLSVDTIHRCLLAHGHGGFSKELPHQQRLRDIIGLELGDGTREIQNVIVMRERVGRAPITQ